MRRRAHPTFLRSEILLPALGSAARKLHPRQMMHNPVMFTVEEGRGKAQADALRGLRTETPARLLDGRAKSSSELVPGDRVEVVAGELIPGDGTIVDGIASIDEAAVTGESAPVVRAAGGDRSAVTGGSRTGSWSRSHSTLVTASSIA